MMLVLPRLPLKSIAGPPEVTQETARLGMMIMSPRLPLKSTAGPPEEHTKSQERTEPHSFKGQKEEKKSERCGFLCE